ncbi:MAG TPA: hypothetical protein VG247_12855 [Pseudonocardiaceae bacterium]|nr:hypothetical protein [Pseudonocardiaceae bacterium]
MHSDRSARQLSLIEDIAALAEQAGARYATPRQRRRGHRADPEQAMTARDGSKR